VPAGDYLCSQFLVSVFVEQDGDTMPGSCVAFRLSAPNGVTHAKAAARTVKR